jgi:uncharacterized protein YndB with AHSA1/START domain
MAMTTTDDRIEKQVLLRAPRSRVWRALTTAEEFGQWFGAKLSGGTFTPGARVRGPITHPGYEHVTFDVTIDRIEPERLVSWRWHPNAIDPQVDYSAEPTTVVTFELEEVPEGTLLKVVETGFDKIPPARRAQAFRGNEDGWAIQMERITEHVSKATDRRA